MAGIADYIALDAYGFSTAQFTSRLIGRFAQRRCLVVGGGRCVWDDLQHMGVRGGAENGGWDVVCVNDIIMHYPGRVRHAYSNDAKWLPKWIEARRELITRQYGSIDHAHTCRPDGAHNVWPWTGHGSSALGATLTALALGYESVILCGVPLDASGHYFDPPWVRSNFVAEVPDRGGEMRFWTAARDKVFRGRVRSVSGRTWNLLGGP